MISGVWTNRIQVAVFQLQSPHEKVSSEEHWGAGMVLLLKKGL